MIYVYISQTCGYKKFTHPSASGWSSQRTLDLGLQMGSRLTCQKCPGKKRPQELKKKYLSVEEASLGKIELCFQMVASMPSWLHSLKHTWMLLTRI